MSICIRLLVCVCPTFVYPRAAPTGLSCDDDDDDVASPEINSNRSFPPVPTPCRPLHPLIRSPPATQDTV
uniref:Putative secreted protein n=1 Tax=Anopheles triannulatus TaxID=58253 RepID=A0A2M4B4S3_9DIPT